MSRPIAVMIAVFVFSLAVVAFSSTAVSAQTETELSKPPESRGFATATGMVTVTILPSPEICGNGVCSKSETCFSCSVDCCLNNPQNLAGLVSGGTTTSASGLFLAGVMAAFLLAVNSRAVLKKKDTEK